MSLLEHHIFICINERPEKDPRGCCNQRGGKEVLAAFREALMARGLRGKVRANKAGCLDQCACGPTVVIYPQGTWYVKVEAKDVPEILDAMVENKTVERLLHTKQQK